MSLLELKNVSYQYPGTSQSILQNINFVVNQDDFLVVLGTNGSGKSTLFKIINKQINEYAGSVVYQNSEIKQISDKIYFDEIKILNQNVHDALFPTLTIHENYLLYNKKVKSLKDHLALFNKNLPDKLNQTVALLSGGEKQSLALALIALHPPKILLLDEHTSALDPVSTKIAMEQTLVMIKQFGVTCIATTHDLEFAKTYGNRIVAMKQGRIHREISTSEKNDMTSSELISVCYL